MSLQTFFSILLRNWWIIAALAILAAVGSAIGAAQQQPVYRASAMVELKPGPGLDKVEQTISMLNLLDKRTPINTIARKATSTSMQVKIAERLKAQGITLTEVTNAEITADVLPQANLIELSASSSNPAHAAAICNTMAEELLDQSSGRVLDVQLIDRALPPAAPIAPQPARLIVLGFLSGLVLGIVVALIGHYLRSPRPLDAARATR